MVDLFIVTDIDAVIGTVLGSCRDSNFSLLLLLFYIFYYFIYYF